MLKLNSVHREIHFQNAGFVLDLKKSIVNQSNLFKRFLH